MGLLSSVGGIIGKGMDFAKGVASSMYSYLGGSEANSGVLSSLGEFGMNTVSGLFGANTQYKNQLKLMKYANDYNSPVNQMKRLAEAGLNPNLVYANGAANLGSATGSAAAMKPATMNLLAAYNLDAQNKFIQAQTAESQGRAELIPEQKAYQKAQTAKLKADTRNLNNYLNGDGRSTYDTSVVKNIDEAIERVPKIVQGVKDTVNGIKKRALEQRGAYWYTVSGRKLFDKQKSVMKDLNYNYKKRPLEYWKHLHYNVPDDF